MKKIYYLLFPLFLLHLFYLHENLFSQGYICAIGGGGEDYNDWSDKPYKWIVEKSGKGKIVILSAGNESEWIPDYFKSFGATEAYNKKIISIIDANNQSIFEDIISAKSVFIKGGDQYDYIKYWKKHKN